MYVWRILRFNFKCVHIFAMHRGWNILDLTQTRYCEFCTRHLKNSKLNIHVNAFIDDAPCVYITKNNCLMLFREIIALYCVNIRYVLIYTYRVSQEECARLREGVPYVKVYRYNPKHLCPKLNGYGDNGQRILKLWQVLHTYWLPNTY